MLNEGTSARCYRRSFGGDTNAVLKWIFSTNHQTLSKLKILCHFKFKQMPPPLPSVWEDYLAQR